MDDDFSGLRNRQDRLEGRMTHLEAKVEREARLRAAMDNELGSISVKLNAQQRSLNALQEVQGDHTRRLTRIEDDVRVLKGDVRILKDDVKVLKEDVGVLKDDMETVKGGLVTVKVGVHAILDLLNANLGDAASD